MGLFTPAWQGATIKDSEKRIAAVRRETSQVKLARIASEAADFEVRVCAIEKITDQTVLLGFATDEEVPSDPYFAARMWMVRCAAAAHLPGEGALKRIATADASLPGREKAFEILYGRKALQDHEIAECIDAIIQKWDEVKNSQEYAWGHIREYFEKTLSPEDFDAYGFEVKRETGVNVYEEGFSQRTSFSVTETFYKGVRIEHVIR